MEHNGILQVLIPTFRPDLEREIDLIEEVARLNGYDAIPETMPVSRLVNQRPSQRYQLAEKVRNLMVASGSAETINYAFINPNVWDKLGLAADDSRRNTVLVNQSAHRRSVGDAYHAGAESAGDRGPQPVVSQS